jgi:hypothetical protein
MTLAFPHRLGVAAIATAAMLFASGPASAQDTKLVFATNAVGSAANRVGAAISGMVSQKTKHTMVATAYAGPSAYVPLLSQGKAQFGFMNGVDSLHAYRGTKPYYNKAHPDFRLAAIGLTNYHAWVVRKDSPIRTAADLKGKRVAGVYAGHSTCRQLSNAHLANYGLTAADVKIVPATGAVSSVKLLASGRVDAATCAVVGMGIIRETDAQIGVRHLDIDPSPEAVARYREIFPSGEPVKIDSKAGPALPKETWVWEYPFYLVTSTKTSDEAVYATVKAVWENLGDLRKTMGAFNRWKQERMVSLGATVPYHPAAIRFYKEKGAWSPELDALQAKLLK